MHEVVPGSDMDLFGLKRLRGTKGRITCRSDLSALRRMIGNNLEPSEEFKCNATT